MKEAFGQMGITVKVNMKDTVLPGRRVGRRRYRDVDVPAFSKWFFNDKHGKSGILFRVKNLLKSRYGAQFFSGDAGEFAGAWWYVSSSESLEEIYKLMA